MRVAETIVDKLNELKLVEIPIFEDPITLSVELSLAIVVIVGKIGSIIAVFLHLPSIIGFLLSGLGIQDLIAPGLIKGCGAGSAKPF